MGQVKCRLARFSLPRATRDWVTASVRVSFLAERRYYMLLLMCFSTYTLSAANTRSMGGSLNTLLSIRQRLVEVGRYLFTVAGFD